MVPHAPGTQRERLTWALPTSRCGDHLTRDERQHHLVHDVHQNLVGERLTWNTIRCVTSAGSTSAISGVTARTHLAP